MDSFIHLGSWMLRCSRFPRFEFVEMWVRNSSGERTWASTWQQSLRFPKNAASNSTSTRTTHSSTREWIRQTSLILMTSTNWFLANDLQLNADKTEAILFGTRQILVKHQDNTVLWLGNCDVKYGSTVKILGVQLDSTLSLIPQVDSIVRSCNYHIRALRHVRNCLTRSHEDDRFRSSDFSTRLLQLFTVQHIEIQHQQVAAYPGPEQSS